MERLRGLDSLRGFACLAVVLCHVLYFDPDYAPQGHFIRTLAGHGALAVELFYCLSAFALAYVYDGKLSSGRGIAAFAVHRYFRIAPLFYFFFILWWFYRYANHAPAPLWHNLATITFTFGFSPDTHGSTVGIGHTIGIEMIFYASLPLFMLVVRGVATGVIALLASLAIAAIAHQQFAQLPYSQFLKNNFLVALPFFACGLLAYQVFARYRVALGALPHLALITVAIAVVYWMVIFLSANPPEGVDIGRSLWWRLIVCLPFPFLVLSFAAGGARPLVNRFTVRLGDLSYGIYLWHTFFILTTIDFRHKYFAPELFGGVWGTFALSFVFILVLSLVAASVSYRYIEAPFIRFARQLTGKKIVEGADDVVSQATSAQALGGGRSGEPLFSPAPEDRTSPV